MFKLLRGLTIEVSLWASISKPLRVATTNNRREEGLKTKGWSQLTAKKREKNVKVQKIENEKIVHCSLLLSILLSSSQNLVFNQLARLAASTLELYPKNLIATGIQRECLEIMSGNDLLIIQKKYIY